MADYETDGAIAACFSVSIDKRDLGLFSSCDGLGCEVVMEQREEGGNNEFVHQLPVRLKYTNLKLARPLNGDSRHVAEWFSSMKGKLTRTTAHVAARRADGSVVIAWNLFGVVPVRWTGPQLSADNAKFATETLEIAHHGFEVAT